MLVDETGSNRRDTIRKMGYDLRGRPARAQKHLVRREHLCVIVTIWQLAVQVQYSVESMRIQGQHIQTLID